MQRYALYLGEELKLSDYLGSRKIRCTQEKQLWRREILQ